MILADLHIHSRYSRATSRDCTPEQLDLWARKKGITLLGTGDFTHPAWRQTLAEQLVPAEEGLYRLREEIPYDGPDQRKPRFVVTGEISSIYKKNGKTRKVHSLILLPGLEEAELLAQKLSAIGNIHSDGRPILGLDCRDLLEITLETCPQAVFVPAHIWTPHFSLFGAFSGFDSMEECFGDLTPHIHAVETGLSSDPSMNWRLSALDGYTLLSNSDAHSPQKLGREANLLDIPLSYPALARAIQTGEGFFGTIEFFPEEGKYHYDGHRACGLCLSPEETEAYGGICPICGKKITIGVEHRVEQLADHPEGRRPPGARPYESLVPLEEVIAASAGLSAAKAQRQYELLLRRLGDEFSILRQLPLEDIRAAGGPCIAEGIRRLREGKVERVPGYDGAYGSVRLLRPAEIDLLNDQTTLFSGETGVPAPKRSLPPPSVRVRSSESASEAPEYAPLNPEQQEAVTTSAPAAAVIAGPGTGKTRTLVSRIVWLVQNCGVKPGAITAVTFTNRAAGELRERLEKALGKRQCRAMTIGTFHGICLALLKEWESAPVLLDGYEALEIAGQVLDTAGQRGGHASPSTRGAKNAPAEFLRMVSEKKCGLEPSRLSEELYQAYCARLREKNLLDFDDLLTAVCENWERAAAKYPQTVRRFTHLLVDEFQDCNQVQYQLTRLWSKNGGLFVIGDPDQSIYGFRGADPLCFQRLFEDLPQLERFYLSKNYRSAPEILQSALSVISRNPGGERILQAAFPKKSETAAVRLISCEKESAEGLAVAREIGRMVGGIDMLAADSAGSDREKPRSFSEIALLCRVRRQAEQLEQCLRREGIPCVVTGRDDFLGDPKVRGILSLLRALPDLEKGILPEQSAAASAALRLLWEFPGENSAWEGPALQTFLQLSEQLWPRISKERPSRLLEFLAEQLGLAEHPPLERLLNTAVLYPDLPSLFQDLLLGQEGDLRRISGKAYSAGAVTLSTLHGAKGLEFPVVFLCGLDKGVFPPKGQESDLAEERRLFYVGMTRAREELILLSGQTPSPFLSELPEDQILRTARQAGPEGFQLRLF